MDSPRSVAGHAQDRRICIFARPFVYPVAASRFFRVDQTISSHLISSELKPTINVLRFHSKRRRRRGGAGRSRRRVTPRALCCRAQPRASLGNGSVGKRARCFFTLFGRRGGKKKKRAACGVCVCVLCRTQFFVAVRNTPKITGSRAFRFPLSRPVRRLSPPRVMRAFSGSCGLWRRFFQSRKTLAVLTIKTKTCRLGGGSRPC